jgi:hypothetical protein
LAEAEELLLDVERMTAFPDLFLNSSTMIVFAVACPPAGTAGRCRRAGGVQTGPLARRS